MQELLKKYKKLTLALDEFGHTNSCPYKAGECQLIDEWLQAVEVSNFLSNDKLSIVLDGVLLDITPNDSCYKLHLRLYVSNNDIIEKVDNIQTKQVMQTHIINYLFAAIISLTIIGTIINVTLKEKTENLFNVVNSLNPLLAAATGYFYSENKRNDSK